MAAHYQLSVLGLGDPVVDICLDVSSKFLGDIKAQPGGCMLIEPKEMQVLLDAASCQARAMSRVPGGSAANVMKGLASMSSGSSRLHCQFMGMVGSDAAGNFYAEELQDHGVDTLLLESTSGAPTARCVCLVTPDGQRTMRTCLGAAAELSSVSQLARCWPAPPATLVHCEGYIMYKPTLAREAMAAAKHGGSLVSLDLASFEVVRGCRDTLMSLLKEGLVDIVFANEDEAAAITEDSTPGGVDAAQSLILQYARCCIVSLGAKGAVARSADGESGSAQASRVSVVDTIGAGDLFSAGFLFAYLQGCTLSTCCAAGCAAGAEAVQSRGTALGEEAWRRLRRTLSGLVPSRSSCSSLSSAMSSGSELSRSLSCFRKQQRSASYVSSMSGISSSSMGSSTSQLWLAMEDTASPPPRVI